MSTGADACETRLMTMIVARIDRLRVDGFKVYVWRQNVGAAIDARTGRKIEFGEAGQSDIMVVVDGHYFGIETKAADGRQSKEQKEFEKRVREAGGTYLIARDLETALDPVIERLGLTGRIRWERDHWELVAA